MCDVVNVLFTSAGRRNEVIDAFRALGHRAVVADMSRYAAAFNSADAAHLSPGLRDPGYPDFVLDVCRSEQIDLVVSLNDYELPMLAALAEPLRRLGVRPIVSSEQVVATCWDKLATDRFLADHGFRIPRTWTLDEVRRGDPMAPLVVKARFGTSSLGVEVVHDLDEFDLVHRYQQRRLALAGLRDFEGAGDLLIQEFVHGEEFAVDVVNDLEGRYHGCVVKRKISTRGGDADCVVTVRDHDIERWCERFSSALGHIANADLDLIVDGRGGVYCVDVNPRFGGAYPFSLLSGVDLPRMIAAWANGETAPAVDPVIGVTTARTERYLVLDRVDDVD